jgi:predicted MFS family arabinose efflux permease
VKPQSKHRWFVVAVFFMFMLLHQSDKLLIGPLTTPIMDTFGINEAQMGAVSTVALIVGAVFYPLWGYLYDRFARARLLAVASAIWGSTTWLNAVAPNYGAFLATRASTGIDDSSYPGLHSIIADYFGPQVRGKIYGLLQLTGPLGYLAGMVLALVLGGIIGWRNVFFITGSLGVILAVVIWFGVKEPPRGQSEPEMANLEELGIYRFEWDKAKQLFRKPTMLLLFIQGFFGVFPWQVITFWIFRYLETERGYDDTQILITMGIVVLVLASGYPLGGAAGDWAFRRTPRGRLIVSSIGVLLGALFLVLAIGVPLDQPVLFVFALAATAIFMPIASPNMISSVYDITLPEVRSTALAIQLFIENAGAATAPLLAGLIAVRADLKTALLLICTTAWVLCSIFYAVGAFLIPKDITVLRRQLAHRAEQEQAAHTAP